jgi:carbonic anhydrase
MHRRTVFRGLTAAAAVALMPVAGLAQNCPVPGDQQSPVVIAATIPAQIQALWIDYPDVSANFTVRNDGYTIKVEPTNKTYTTTYGTTVYTLKEFHFHQPAEHEAPGLPARMELHFVNTAANGNAVAIAVFLQSQDANEAFRTIMRAAPARNGDKPVTVTINPNQLLPVDRHYWMYMGSLTTCPLTQNVRWIVLQHGVKVDDLSMDRFHAIFPEGDARKVMDINRRFILSGP